MRKAKVIFDITETKTEVTVIDTKGIPETIDITDTKIEKAFVRLLKQISQESDERKLVNETMKAVDINTWHEA